MATLLPDTVRRRPLAEDLSAVADLVGDARVVALGENNHHIAEFGALRARLVGFLVAELGFTVVAAESGFPEGLRVDDWIGGGHSAERDEVLATGFTFRYGDAPGIDTLIDGLRRHNAPGGHVRFAGLDVPGSGGSPLPALEVVRRHLAARSPADVALVDDVVRATRAWHGANNALAAARYAGVDTARRDAATGASTRLLHRVRALPHPAGDAGHAVAEHAALGALRLDEHLREIETISAPDPPSRAGSARDVHQAETVHMLRALHGPDARVVLLLHNGHLQRRPLRLQPAVTVPSAGSLLAGTLGDRYRAVGITAVSGATTTARPDPAERDGIALGTTPLPPPAAGALEASGAGRDRPELLDLRPARGRAGPTAIRHAADHVAVDVLDAFDGFVCLPPDDARPARRRRTGRSTIVHVLSRTVRLPAESGPSVRAALLE